jgi:hypothetical protein
MRIVYLIVVLLMSMPAWTAEPAKKPAPVPSGAVPPPPPIPKRSAPSDGPAEPENNFEPEITITTRGDTTYEEHRSNGRVYMIKVTPKQGKPYYLIDEEGAGQFRRSDLEPKILVPRWVIKSW